MNATGELAPLHLPYGLRDIAKTLRTHEPRFYQLGVVLALALIPTVFAASLDGRIFQGEDNWIKPLKFEAALTIYLFTLAFFARWLPKGTTAKSWYRLYISLVATAIVIEMIWIGGAAAVGTASHFNSSPEGQLIYSFMGVAAVLLTSPTAVYAWLIARNPASGLPPAVKQAIVLGLALTLPLTLLTAGTMSTMAGHAVGGSGPAAGTFPVMGWLRDGGDLRVAHFFATHAMHAIPAFGIVSLVIWGGSSRLPVRLFSLAYCAFVAWVFAEALAGLPFLPGVG